MITQNRGERPIAPQPLPEALRLFALLTLVLTSACILLAIISRAAGLGLPYTSAYYYVPGEMFGDFTGFTQKFSLYGTPAFFTERGGLFVYPAPMLFVVRLFWLLPGAAHMLVLFLAAVLAIAVAFTERFNAALAALGLERGWRWLFLAAVFIGSYPLMCDLQRANLEAAVWLFSTIGVWCFYRGRPSVAAVALGVAISLKVYPFILLGIFFSTRRYRAMFLAIATAVGLTLLTYAAIGPTVLEAYRWNTGNLAEFSQRVAGLSTHLGFDHSLFSVIKFVEGSGQMLRWTRPYTATVASGSLVLYFTRIWRMPLTNQILALSVLTILIPPVSYDYTLLNLYAAFAILCCVAVQAERSSVKVPLLTAYMVLFALVFTPESYVILHGTRYGGQLRALCLIALVVLSVTKPFPDFAPVLRGRPQGSGEGPLPDDEVQVPAVSGAAGRARMVESRVI